MSFYTDFPLYPTSVFSDANYPTQVDNTDTVYAALINALKEEMQACFNELGTLPKGLHASVKARIEALEAQLKGVLDYMEYATPAAAQAAYVSSGGYSSDLIPTMTSNTAPSGTCSAESEHSATYAAWKAFNNDGTTSQWLSTWQAPLPEWIQYDFGSGVAHVFRRCVITPWNDVNWRPKDYTIYGSNNGSNWTSLASGTQFDETGMAAKTTDFANITAYRYLRITITSRWASANEDGAGIAEIEVMSVPLQCYSESTIKQQGSYSLKCIAEITDSLNDTLTRTVDPVKDLTGKTKITLWAYSNRTGENFKVEFHDSGGNTISYTVNILSTATWEKKEIDISAVADGDKYSINEIKYTILNAGAAATFYLDDNFAT